MKNHKIKKIEICDGFNGPVQDLINLLTEYSEGMIDPEIVSEYSLYCSDEEDYYVQGWVPMTKEEIAKANAIAIKRKQASKKANLTKAEKQKKVELDQLAKLKKKYEGA